MTFKIIENRWEASVVVESEGERAELVYDKQDQTLRYATFSLDDPEGTLQVTELGKVETIMAA